MRYHDFRDHLRDRLTDAGLFSRHIGQVFETIDLADTHRCCRFSVCRSEERAEPFHVSAEIAFGWSPFDAARAYTTEEDLLVELFGRGKQEGQTQRRWKRVDLELHANLPYGSTTPLPDPQLLSSWTASVAEKLDSLFSDVTKRGRRVVAVLGGREEVKVRCKAGTPLSLDGLSVSGFRIVEVPRIWDDPERRSREKGIDRELARLAKRFNQAFVAWTDSLAELATWIRYSPPLPDAKPLQPRVENEEEENGGPETIH